MNNIIMFYNKIIYLGIKIVVLRAKAQLFLTLATQVEVNQEENKNIKKN